MGNKRGRQVKKQRSLAQVEDESLTKAPHCFVVHRGLVSPHVSVLEKDFRGIMEPFTASQLKVRKSNTLKDYLQVCGIFGVTNMVVFSQTERGVNMRLGRIPRGPTVTFRVKEYSLSRDVRSSLKRQMVYERLNLYSPLLVLSGFGAAASEDKHLLLISKLFQNMFPTINVATVELKKILRVVLLHYDHEEKCITLRHYAIKVVPVANRAVKKLVSNKVPNLAKYKDMKDYVTKCGIMSESEGEDDPDSHVSVPQDLNQRGNVKQLTSSVRLVELGPRLKLEVMKVEEDLFKGEILYHSIVSKSPEELERIRQFREEKKRLKEERRRQQEENVRKKKLAEAAAEAEVEGPESKKDEEDEDDDRQWYKKEIGADPDAELFPAKKAEKRKKSDVEVDPLERKRRRKEEERKEKEKFLKKLSKLKAKRKRRQQLGSNRHKTKGKNTKKK